jgi:hypothetical protein
MVKHRGRKEDKNPQRLGRFISLAGFHDELISKGVQNEE